jgi:hypothetical protein
MISESSIVGSVTAQIPVTAEMIDNIFICGFDGVYGACHYWASNVTTVSRDNMVESVTLVEDETQTAYTITTKDIVGAIQRFVDVDESYANNTITGTIRNSVYENDPGMIDADCADCIIQLALFGEVMYG